MNMLFPIIIEGGLGSQIMGYMSYLTARESGSRGLCNLTYFSQSRQQSRPKDGLSIWPWGLDYYHIRMQDIPTSKLLDGATPFSRILNRFCRVFDKTRPREFCKKMKFNSVFPMAPETTDEIAELMGGHVDHYAVIHVRGGDYHSVASLVYSPEERLRQVALFRRVLPQTLCFVSDDPFRSRFREEAERLLPGKTFHWLGGRMNQYTIHGMMRKSSLLFAANSTFSITAGLLQDQHGLTIMPSRYASDRHVSLNNGYRELAEFLVL